MKQYYDLFQIALQHTFYADGRAKDLILEPTQETWQFMRQFDLRWGVNQGLYFMAYGQEVGSVAKLSYLAKPVALRFLLKSNNPYFQHITDLPFFQPGQQVLYFDNLHTSAASGVLTVKDRTVPEDILPLAGPVFRVDQLHALRNAKHQELLADPLSEIPVWSMYDEANPSKGIKIDLRDLPPGKYGYDDAPGHSRWFYYPGQELHPGDLGVIEINVGKGDKRWVSPPAPADDAVLRAEQKSLTNRTFKIEFGNRATFWRYYVINKNNVAFDQLMVDDDQHFTVGQLGSTMRSGAFEAIPIVSKTALPLKERQTLKPKLKLIKTKGNSSFIGTTATLELPTPDWRSITPEENGKVVYSDMYVFL